MWIIVIVVIIIVILIVFLFNKVNNLTEKMNKKDSTLAKTIALGLGIEESKIHNLKNVEREDRIRRLVDSNSTNMTELGMAIEGLRDVYHITSTPKGFHNIFVLRFRYFTDAMISYTKGIDIGSLLDDSVDDRDFMKNLIAHWSYYNLIYNFVWNEYTKKNSDEVNRNIKAEWDTYYKDNKYEYLHDNYGDIMELFNRMYRESDKRDELYGRIIQKIDEIMS